MKHINSKILIILSCGLLFACTAMGGNDLTWKHDGTVSLGSAKRFKLNMQNVYSGLTFREYLYVIGYQIDKTGINYPAVARISQRLDKAQYWSFNHDLQDIFVFNHTLYISDTEGDVYSMVKSDWKKSTIQLKPSSKVIESNNDIIACIPSSLFKASKKIGSCYALQRGWSVTVNWRIVKPKICAGALHVFEHNPGGMLAKRIDVSDGKILKSITLHTKPEDLCEISFKG